MSGHDASAPPPPPAAPTMDNSKEALEKARKQQEQARGSAATVFSNQSKPTGPDGEDLARKKLMGI